MGRDSFIQKITIYSHIFLKLSDRMLKDPMKVWVSAHWGLAAIV